MTAFLTTRGEGTLGRQPPQFSSTFPPPEELPQMGHLGLHALDSATPSTPPHFAHADQLRFTPPDQHLPHRTVQTASTG